MTITTQSNHTNIRRFPLVRRHVAGNIQQSSIIENSFLILTLLAIVALIHVILLSCDRFLNLLSSIYLSLINIYAAANFDTDSDSDSDEIYLNDRHNLENDEAYDGDDEADNSQIGILLDGILNILLEYQEDSTSEDEDSTSDEEDSNSDEEDSIINVEDGHRNEEDGHRNEDIYHRSQDVSGIGNNNTTI